MLLLLLSGQRCKTIHCLELKGINMNELHCKIMVPSLLKQSRPGYHLKPLEFEPYKNKNLCVLSNLRQYICKTKNIRNNEQKLFISYKKPHKHVSKATISRWCKEILFCAGIDVKQFGPHSVRAASTSFAKEKGIPLSTIMEAAGWKNAGTFQKLYSIVILHEKLCKTKT